MTHRVSSSHLSLVALSLVLGWNLIDPVTRAQAAGTVGIEALKATSLSGRTFKAAPGEAREVLLADGTSLRLSPGASLTIGAYRYDPASGAGSLSLTIHGGTVRVSGGLINDKAPIAITTPQATLSLDAGAALVSVSGGRTRAHLLTGTGFDFTSGGTTQRIFRPEFEVSSDAGAPTSPTRMAAAASYADQTEVNPGMATRAVPQIEAAGAGEVAAPVRVKKPKPRLAQRPSSSSAAGGQASQGAGTGTPAPQGGMASAALPVFPPLPDPLSGDSNCVATASTEASTESAADASGGDCNLAQAPDQTVDTQPRVQAAANDEIIQIRVAQPLSVSDGVVAVGIIKKDLYVSTSVFPQNAQWMIESGYPSPENRRRLGPTSNRVYPLEAFTQVGLGDGRPVPTSLRNADGYNIFGAESWLLGQSQLVGNGNPIGPVFGISVQDKHILDFNSGKVCAQESCWVGDSATRTFPVVGRSMVFGIEFASRERDNFFAVDYKVLLESGASGSYFFAAGDIGEMFDASSTVEEFNLSSGLSGLRMHDGFLVDALGDRISGGIVAGLRAFVPDTRLESFDPGLLVVNPSNQSSTGTASRLLHVDFGSDVRANDDGRIRSSTISTTTGPVHYRPDDQDGSDAIVDLRTVASTKLEGEGSTSFDSPIFSTAAGGGNPAVNTPGRMGYVVLENYGKLFDDAAMPGYERPGLSSSGLMPGGTIDPMGNGQSDQQSYALLRLGIATSTTPLDRYPGHLRRQIEATSVTGFAAGLVEVESGSSIGIADFSVVSADPNVRLRAGDDGISLVGSLGGIALQNGTYINDTAFGATAQGGKVAMVSGEMVKTALGDSAPGTFAPDSQGKSGKAAYDYIQWGFFFGDIDNSPRSHVHLGSFVTGQPIKPGELPLRTTKGTVTYTGHMFGNVSTGNDIYSAVGTYQDKFNFSRRQGTLTATFDGATYKGGSAWPSGSTYLGRMYSGDRKGSLAGQFVGPMVPGPQTLVPAGVVGQFAITGKAYTARGTFGAEK